MIKRLSGLLAGVVMAATVAVLLPAGAAMADVNGCPTDKSALTSNRVGVTTTTSGNDVTYTFESFVTEGSGGIPGLIEYCIYPDAAPDSVVTVALGDDGSAWGDPPGFNNFSFQRPDGNPSNIPYDGASHEMGTATWDSGVPTGFDTIVLHINDPAECDALYGGGALTCFVLPGTNGGGGGEGAALGIDKTATGSYDNTFAWQITKDVDKTIVKQFGGTATFNYTVKVSHDAGTVSNIAVKGTITVTNPNGDPVTIDSLTDQLSDGTNCAITGGAPTTVPAGDSTYDYTCSPGDTGATSNTATVSWSDQTLANGDALLGGSAPITVPVSFTGNNIDECTSVSDSYAGSLGTVCVGDPNPTTFNYSRDIPVPAFDCLSYDNTASFTTNDTGATGSAGQTVTVCGPAKTGALTMGFWQNKNGQAIIKSYSGTNCQSLRTWLNGYSPFADLTATNCAGVQAYVTNVIKAANASGASMNAMLKAQMLATALDVYFSDSALGGNRIGAPYAIGGKTIDLTLVCATVALNGTCQGGITENVSSAFGGATSLTVSQILAYAASQSNAGGSVWYGQVKKTQEMAKDTFDAINNQVAFDP